MTKMQRNSSYTINFHTNVINVYLFGCFSVYQAKTTELLMKFGIQTGY